VERLVRGVHSTLRFTTSDYHTPDNGPDCICRSTLPTGDAAVSDRLPHESYTPDTPSSENFAFDPSRESLCSRQPRAAWKQQPHRITRHLCTVPDISLTPPNGKAKPRQMFSRSLDPRTIFFSELLSIHQPTSFVERARFGVGLSDLLDRGVPSTSRRDC